MGLGDGTFGDRGDFRYGGEFADGREFLNGMYGPGARDQRLESFAQGRWGDRATVGAGGRAAGWLALQAGDVSQPEVLAEATSDEVLGVGRAWKSLETWCFTGKLAVVRELIRRYPLNEDAEPGRVAGGLPDEWDPRLHHEVAAALGISVVAAGKLVNLAWTLDSRLREVGQALEELRLDPGRVKMIVDETAVLDREDLFARAEKIILAGRARCKTWSDLVRLVQRAVITVDPDGARKRREQAEREHARIQFWRESTGTCALRGTGLPTDQALAATANIEARALEYKAVPVRRSMDILRVMAYLDLINGVPVAQRAAWAQAEDEDEARKDEAGRAETDEQAARDAELREATRQAKEKARQKAKEKARPRPAGASQGQDPAEGGGPDGSGPDDRDGHGAFPDDWPPSEGDDPDDEGPDDDGSDDGGPDDSGPDDEGPDDGRDGDPDSTGPQGDPDDDSTGGLSGGWPADGGEGDLDGGDPGGNDPGIASRDDGPCPGCGGAGGVAGLPIRANLTLPAGAVGWLAGWTGQGPGSARSDPRAHGSSGGGAGGGGPGGSHLGSGYRSGPGPCPECGDRGRYTMPVRGDLAFPLLTVLGLAQRPGEAHGLGALDPGLVRALAGAGARHPASEFCVTITDEQGHAIGHGCGKPLRGKAGKAIPLAFDRVTFTPSGRAGPEGGFGSWVLTVPGASLPFIVDIDVVPTHECDHRHASPGYQPSGRLRHLVQVRDGTCSFPACSRHARESDFEHAIAHGTGGRTCACNAHACSRSCHRVKQSSGWQVTKPRPGWTQWTTMAGRTYTQGPWSYPI